MHPSFHHLVAIVGAGPAGIFAARELANQGVRVVLFNRDIKPGGLAEYGIYPDKIKMKTGLRAQFQQILANPGVEYFGNVLVGKRGDIRLEELREFGFQAIMVTAGAQGTKWLGLPGEQLRGVYHAKDVVYHYNQLPPYSEQVLDIGRRVAIVGVGNVMMDIARFLISRRKVDEVVAFARRGPAEIKFDRKELEAVVANLDLAAFECEIDRVAPVMRSLGQHPEIAKEFIRSAAARGAWIQSRSKFWIRFLSSPRRIVDSGSGRLGGLEVEDTDLVLDGNEVKARGLGTIQTFAVDTVIFAIGDRVDDELGLPVHNFAYDKNPQPRFPIEGESFEAYDSERNEPIPGIFVAGWSRKASSGLVGVARKDGVNGARAVLQYLRDKPACSAELLERLYSRLMQLPHPVVMRESLALLEKAEQQRMRAEGLEDFKFASNQEMLETMGLLNKVS
ncbi:MAG: FAD-dependent oxidoreductase [Chloroflexota bacterium]|jgi:ferredoxin--NADP+ reductase